MNDIQALFQEVAITAKLVTEDGAEGDNFGSSVAVAGDVMVVAAPYADVGDGETSGAVYVFLRDALGEWSEHQHLLPANGSFGDNFYELTLAIDGDTIVVGAPYTTVADFQEGMVYIFQRDQGGSGLWGEVARLSDVSVEFGGHFGASIALQGELLVVGAPQDSSFRNGLVQIFERDRGGPGNWGKVTTLSYASVGDAAHPRSFGCDVALEGDLLVIGASRTSVSWIGQYDGAAYLFRRDATDRDQWTNVARVIVPGADQCVGGLTVSQFLATASFEERAAADACADEHRGDSGSFGHRVAIDGDTLVVTALFAKGEDGSYSVGRAYVFERDQDGADRWHYVTTLSPSIPTGGAYFGSSLALAGDAVLVGAPGTNVGSQARQGAAYLFERSANGPDAWGEVEQLLAGDGMSDGSFGTAVAFDGATRIVGARGDSVYRGALYLYTQEQPQEPTGPAFEPTGELLNDGIVEHAGGAMLGAVGMSLGEPLPVWIHEVDSPAEPLMAPATPIRPFYNVGAIATTSPSEGTFALALPVPEEADTTHLALAILVPPHHLLDSAGTGFCWHPIQGSFNPELRLFSITLHALLPEGRTVVLIDYPGFEPLYSEAGLRSTSGPSPAPAPTFEVRCILDGFAPYECGEAEKEKVLALFEAAYDNYRALDYPEPALRTGSMRTEQSDPDRPRKFVWVPVTTYDAIRIRNKTADPKCEDLRGVYAPLERAITICIGGGFTDAELTKTARHELFHAVQQGAPAYHEDWAATDWSTDANGNYKDLRKVEDFMWMADGTAEAAEDSDAAMFRSQQQILHPINRSLLESPKGPDDKDKIAYQAQDFWVYFGKKKGLGLGYLKALFQRGAAPSAADHFFAYDYQTSLGDEYWSWVKNQAMEKTIDFDNRLQSPCTLETSLVGKMADLLYPPGDAPASVSGRLTRLTSAVVRIVIVRPVGPITVSATAAEAIFHKLCYKVYREGDPDCAGVADGARSFPELPAGAFLYVILSNLKYDPEEVLDYTVSVTESDEPTP